MQNNEIVSQINVYAMRNGIVLGLFGVATLAVFRHSFDVPFLSTLFLVMLLFTPVLCLWQTLCMRRETVGENESFGFTRGFLHALFTGFYASIWIALVTFVYLQYFDGGAIFAAYARSLDTPEVQLYLTQTGIDKQLVEMTGQGGAKGLADAMASIGAATYAAMSIYFTLIFGPVISAVIGLVCRRG